MGWRIVKQPNGLLARFSDVVDTFTDVNMTEDEAVSMCMHEYGLSLSEAQTKVRAGVEDWRPYTNGVKGSGLDRWDAAIKSIHFRHGEKACSDILSSIGSAFVAPSAAEKKTQVEDLLVARYKANEADTGLYWVGTGYVVFDMVDDQPAFTWFDDALPLPGNGVGTAAAAEGRAGE